MTPEELAMLEQYIAFLMGGGDAGLASALGPIGDKDPNTNTYQDRIQILGDPLSAMLAGAGASDYSAFMPTVERTPVDNPGWLQAQQWAAAPLGSAMRAMYDFITVDGMDVNSAFTEVRKLVEADTEGASLLTQSLPPDDIFNGEVQPGTGLRSLYEQAQGMQAGLASAPTGAIPDGMGGYYTETETPSPLAEQWRNEYALPLPTETYEIDPEVAIQSLMREGDGYRPGMEGVNPDGLVAQQAAMNRQLTDWSAGTRGIRDQLPTTARSGSSMGEAPVGPPYDPNWTPGGGGGGWNPLEAPGWAIDRLGRLNDAPEGGGGGGNPFEVLGRLGGGNTPQSQSSGGRSVPAGGFVPQDAKEKNAMRQAALARALGGGGRQNTQRRLQETINQGTKDRRQTRIAADPGGRQAIESMRNNASNGRGKSLDPGLSFHTLEQAIAGRRAYEDTQQSTPMMDAIRQRMLNQQLAGF